jgi:hypothetical protein
MSTTTLKNEIQNLIQNLKKASELMSGSKHVLKQLSNFRVCESNPAFESLHYLEITKLTMAHESVMKKQQGLEEVIQNLIQVHDKMK